MFLDILTVRSLGRLTDVAIENVSCSVEKEKGKVEVLIWRHFLEGQVNVDSLVRLSIPPGQVVVYEQDDVDG